MRFENIPSELKSLPQWVCAWRNSKVPMQANMKKAAASSTPETWATFEDAKAAVDKGRYAYLGFVFADNGIVGIDLDAGFDEDGFLSPLAIDIIRHCTSYTEKSKSGRGVHILVKGTLPFKGKNNRAGVEVYQTGRYFIMTGDTLIYPEIIENQAAIDYIVEKYFPDVPKESSGMSAPQRIYSPVYTKPTNGKVQLKPTYPPILHGSRNLSLTSLAGQMHSQGYTKADIYKELLYANQQACQPPLPQSEVEMIVNSVTRYRR